MSSANEFPSLETLPESNNHIFEHYIWSNPGICNNCFARIKDIAVPWREKYRPSIRPALAEEHYIAKDGEQGHDSRRMDQYGIQEEFRARVTCSRCGSVGGRASPEKLSQREMVRRVPWLRNRLEEEGFAVDEDRLRDAIHRGKEKESLQGYDREIFGLATKIAVR